MHKAQHLSAHRQFQRDPGHHQRAYAVMQPLAKHSTLMSIYLRGWYTILTRAPMLICKHHKIF